jgi:hypothetical protein
MTPTYRYSLADLAENVSRWIERNPRASIAMMALVLIIIAMFLLAAWWDQKR